MKRRGMSQVITSVLIILIVLAAIFLLWTFIRPLIMGVGGQIEKTEDCLAIGLTLNSCEANVGTGGYTAIVNVERSSGSSDMTGLNLIFSDEDNTKVQKITENVLGPLDRRSYTVQGLTFMPTNVDVAPIVGEREESCDAQEVPVVCSLSG